MRRHLHFVAILLAVCSAPAVAADSIRGVVRNQTGGSPPAGDEVILLRLDQGMQEEARTTTDSQGAFTLPVSFPDKAHLVRVRHQGVNYDQRASSGDLVSIDVFESAPKVEGITGSIEIIRSGTNGKLLHVSDMIELKNDSRPPLTQAGERTFEVYLPPNAKVDSVMAAGPGKITVLVSAAPVPGEPGHFAVNFPLRPGATKFAFNYDVPYGGHARFRPRSAYPLQQLAVMIPPTMKFTSRSHAFQILPTGNSGYQVAAASPVKAGEGPEFEISGAGAPPALQAKIQAPPKTQPALVTPLPSSSMATVGTTNVQGYTLFPLSRLQWWILALVTGLAFGVYVFLLWRGPRPSRSAVGAEQSAQTSTSHVEILQQELFQLEIDRATGAISGAEYDSAKQALEGTVKRVLGRCVGARTS